MLVTELDAEVRKFEDWDVRCGVYVVAMAVVIMLCVNVVELATRCGMQSNHVWSNFPPCKHSVLKFCWHCAS